MIGWPQILLLVASCLLCAVGTETTFYILTRSQHSYPAIWYHTEHDLTKLLCYDHRFLGVADYDLRSERPFGELRHAANTDNDSSLQDLDPLLVPHAIQVTLNEAGFRERPLSSFSTGGATTLIIGDSFGAGQGVRVQDRFTNLLEELLSESNVDHYFANLCVMGHNIRSINKTLTRNMDAFPHLERVIYAMTLNDPVGDERALEMYHVTDDLMHLRTNLLAKHASIPLLGWSHSVAWLRQRVVHWQISEQTVARYQHLFSDNAGWRRTTQILNRMRDRCLDEGVAFVIVLFPLFHSLDNYPFAQAHGAVRAYAQEAGIEFVDLFELFDGRRAADLWVHPRDFHPNHRVHREVADFLLGKIAW